ncbi:hypothetical protein ATE84_5031 [Aquimarina sp. MAR_2010_214]|nr:hypothetical protein ATE84_5031 [Aquimarina sp. MAR_2010_214]
MTPSNSQPMLTCLFNKQRRYCSGVNIKGVLLYTTDNYKDRNL